MSDEDCGSDMEYSDDDTDCDELYYYMDDYRDIEQPDLLKQDPEYFPYDCLSVEEVELMLNESVEALSNSLQVSIS